MDHVNDRAEHAERQAEVAQAAADRADGAAQVADEAAASSVAVAEQINDSTDLVVETTPYVPASPPEQAPRLPAAPLALQHRLLRRVRRPRRRLPQPAAAQHLLGADPAGALHVPGDRAQPQRRVVHAQGHAPGPLGPARALRGDHGAGAVRRRRRAGHQRADHPDHPERPGLARQPAAQPAGPVPRRPLRRDPQGAGLRLAGRLRGEGLRRRARRRPGGALRARQLAHRHRADGLLPGHAAQHQARGVQPRARLDASAGQRAGRPDHPLHRCVRRRRVPGVGLRRPEHAGLHLCWWAWATTPSRWRSSSACSR